MRRKTAAARSGGGESGRSQLRPQGTSGSRKDDDRREPPEYGNAGLPEKRQGEESLPRQYGETSWRSSCPYLPLIICIPARYSSHTVFLIVQISNQSRYGCEHQKPIGFIIGQFSFRRILIGRAKVKCSTRTDQNKTSTYYLSLSCLFNLLLWCKPEAGE